MPKQKTTHQLRRATGLNRLGGANSLGSEKLAPDTGSKSVARRDDALSSLSPDPMKLAPGGSRQFADQDTASYAAYAHGSSRSRKSAPGGDEGMLEGTVGGALRARQWKGRA